MQWVITGTRQLALALTHALGAGAVALALGQRRLGAADNRAGERFEQDSRAGYPAT